MKHPIYPTAALAVWALMGWSLSPLAFILPDLGRMSVAHADELSQLIQRDRTNEIAETARGEIGRPAAERSIRDLLRLGRWLHLNGGANLAADCYEAVLDAARDQKLPNAKRLVVYRLAAGIRMELGQRKAAGELLRAAIALSDQSEPKTDSKPDFKADFKTGAMLHELALGYLRDKQFDSAIAPFELAANHLSDEAAMANELGLAWALASRDTDHLDAASHLENFANRHPHHRDAVHAILKANQCYARQLDSISLDQLADHATTSGHSLAINGWIRTGGTADQVRRWIKPSRGEQPTELAIAWARRLLNHSADSPPNESETPKPLQTTASIRELAAKWLARQGKWDIIAATAESEIATLENPGSGDSVDPSDSQTHVQTQSDAQGIRSVGLERWFAESLMQVGRTDQSLVWWNHLLDDRNASDFATRLRCAEAETSAGTSIRKAKDRIAGARKAVDGDLRRQSLVDLLDAQLKIRSADFDLSRQMLSEILSRDHWDSEILARAQDSQILARAQDSQILARAQWLIGETFYLGRRYEEAIEAYRNVENLAPDSEYAAAALIQAGKSFEQLGRTRQAAICYGHLLSRFDTSPHAEPARKRLARMEPMPPQVASRPQSDTPLSTSSQR